MNWWEQQPRDKNGRWVKQGSSSFGALNAFDGTISNEQLKMGLKIGIGVTGVVMASRFGNYQPAAGYLSKTAISTATHRSASHIYFKTPIIRSAVVGTKSNNIQVAGQAFGYRRTLDDKISGAVKGAASGKFNNNPYNKSFQLGKLPYQTWRL